MYKKEKSVKIFFCLGGMRVDEQEIQRLVEEVSLQYFEVPFLHKAVFNNRLRTTGGRYLLKSHNIELNYRYYEVYGEEELVVGLLNMSFVIITYILQEEGISTCPST